MVKSKELKLMRKKIEKAEKLPNPLAALEKTPANDLPFALPHDNDTDKAYSLQATAASNLSPDLLQKLLDIFQDNMGDLYRASSWGLDLDDKARQLGHRKARYLLLWSNSNHANTPEEDDNNDENKTLAAFVHYRFDFDDDERPEFAVLYVYEIQVVDGFQRQGLGGALMAVLEALGRATDMSKVMLTVLNQNVGAAEFYRQKCGYVVDASDPSNYNDPTADYKILSKTL